MDIQNKRLGDFFAQVVKSDLRDWNMTSETTAANGALKREFENKATREKLQVTERTYFDPLDEMEVTSIRATGTHNGRHVGVSLIIKPMID